MPLPAINWPKWASTRFDERVMMIHQCPHYVFPPDDEARKFLEPKYGAILKIQEIMFGTGLRAMYITFADARAKANLCKDTAPGVVISLFRHHLRWKFMRVGHLYTHYIPPKEVMEMLAGPGNEPLPPDVRAAYEKLVEEEAPARLDAHAHAPLPSTPTGPRLTRTNTGASADASPATSSVAGPSRSSATSASSLSTPTRLFQSSNADAGPSDSNQDDLTQQVSALRARLREVERKIDATESLSISSPHPHSDVKEKGLDDAKEYYEKQREKRRLAEENVEDAERDLRETTKKRDAARESRQERQKRETAVLIEDAVNHENALKMHTAARQKELVDHASARLKLEQELRELSAERSAVDGQISAMAGETTMGSLYVQAFEALRVASSATLQAI